MKKSFAVLLAFTCCLALCACAHTTLPMTTPEMPVDNSTPEPTAQLPNPTREVNAEELCNESSLAFMMPIGAEDVRCCIIDSEPVVYEMSFTLKGKSCTVRAAHTDTLDESIAGVYETFSTVGDGESAGGDPISWYLDESGDAGAYFCHTGGVTWSVYMTGGASEEQMCEVLRNFVPSL